jgi:hypothetical protein
VRVLVVGAAYELGTVAEDVLVAGAGDAVETAGAAEDGAVGERWETGAVAAGCCF